LVRDFYLQSNDAVNVVVGGQRAGGALGGSFQPIQNISDQLEKGCPFML
jgi:hypothetical protein